MGKPRRGAADSDSNNNVGQDDVQLSVLELVLTSMCAAVEAQAIQSEEAESPLPAEGSLLVRYREVMRKLPIERALQAVNAWSLAKFQRAKPQFQREIMYPADAKPAPDEDLQQQQEDELPVSEQTAKKAKKQRKWPLRAIKSDDSLELFLIERIDEDPLEARWDHRGNPVAIRRNILGEHYAPRSDPLQFTKSAKARSPTEIYQQMKRAVCADLAIREKRRIQALNDREKLRKQQAGELSPEAALEAKFDRMFFEGTAEPQEIGAVVTKGGERDAGSNDDESADDDTDEASDSESNEERRQVRMN